jgi:nucleotide-binding universal stress UspA family protein
MTLKHILVHIDDSRNLDSRLRVARKMATEHEAQITGLYVIAPPFVPTYMSGYVTAGFYENQRQSAEEAAQQARERFDEQAESSGLTHDWISTDGPPADKVAEFARYADLVVLGQPDPEEYSAGDPGRELPGSVILESGRPVLMVPYAGTFDHVGSTVMVMWNASREAARAVYDALPVLKAAKKVIVTSVNPGHGAPDIGDLPGADIAHQLARHGVKAETAPTYAEDMHVDDLILSRGSDMAADLIVMGGYGRSRVRELILGGATRGILDHMTIPVIFSH